jgi:hypothetical protein
MEKYQAIHNLLLRVSRVQKVLRTLYIDTTHFENPDEPLQRGVDARQRYASQAERKLGVFEPGSRAERTVHNLRFRMTWFMDVFGRYIMDRGIATHWEAMRRRLCKLRSGAPTPAGRPGTPDSYMKEGDEGYLELPETDDLSDEDSLNEIQGVKTTTIHSIYSLIAYHHFTLDKIIRATLLSPNPGYQVTFKILMSLFGLVLDLGKLIKEVIRGSVGIEVAEERIEGIRVDWYEREAIFASCFLLWRNELMRSDTRSKPFITKDDRERGD